MLKGILGQVEYYNWYYLFIRWQNLIRNKFYQWKIL